MLLGLVLASLLPQAAAAQQNNYYVSTTGSDSNSGLSPSAAWKTITHASQALALGSNGTIVHVAPGTYTEAVQTSASGTASAQVIYLSDTKWGAVINPSSTPNRYAWYNGGSYSTVQNFEIASAACIGLQQDGSHQTALGNNVHNTASGCSTGANGGAGIDDTNYSGTGNSQIGNFVHDVGMVSANPSCLSRTNSEVQGIYHAHSGGTISNNLVVHNCDDGISMWHAASHTVVVNNTVVHNGQGIDVGSGDAPCSTSGCPGNDYTLVYNNISAYNKNGIYSAASDGGIIGSHNQYSYNLVYGNSQNDIDPYGAGVRCTPGCIVGHNPLFINDTGTSSGNYQLQSGSPAIGAGTTSDAPNADYLGVTRTPPITIGAYQFATPGVSAPTASLYEPASGATFTSPAHFTVGVVAKESGGCSAIQGVNIYVDGALAGGTAMMNAAGCEYGRTLYHTLAVGAHTIYAVATDTAGNKATSNTISVTVQ